MFYVLISVKRDFTDYGRFRRILDESLKDIGDAIEIVEGGTKGSDALPRKCSLELGLKCREFAELWDINGRSAGAIRNSEMVKFIAGKDYKAIFFWDGKSKGTLII